MIKVTLQPIECSVRSMLKVVDGSSVYEHAISAVELQDIKQVVDARYEEVYSLLNSPFGIGGA